MLWKRLNARSSPCVHCSIVSIGAVANHQLLTRCTWIWSAPRQSDLIRLNRNDSKPIVGKKSHSFSPSRADIIMIRDFRLISSVLLINFNQTRKRAFLRDPHISRGTPFIPTDTIFVLLMSYCIQFEWNIGSRKSRNSSLVSIARFLGSLAPSSAARSSASELRRIFASDR